jgi:hypothetical protein
LPELHLRSLHSHHRAYERAGANCNADRYRGPADGEQNPDSALGDPDPDPGFCHEDADESRGASIADSDTYADSADENAVRSAITAASPGLGPGIAPQGGETLGMMLRTLAPAARSSFGSGSTAR